MNSDQQSQIKLLISKGKEQGFLTYREVNDHLPDEIVDPEQIEDIIGMINDMGIPVHEVAPDSDALLIADTNAPDEDAAEEAAAALASVEGDFGRTTDPVRMYMREMGTVELLTREGEILLAKRIEEGLRQVLSSLASYPATVGIFLKGVEKIYAEESRLSDLIIGFIDPNETDDAIDIGSIPIPTPAPPAADGDSSDEEVDTGPDPEEARIRFERLKQQHAEYEITLKAQGKRHPDIRKLEEQLSDTLMEFKLAPRFVLQMAINLRLIVDRVRRQEREIMEICVKRSRMPRKEFISSFQKMKPF